MESWLEIRPIPETPGLSRREVEGAAWRAIVRERLGPDKIVTYNENGAPVLERGLGYIGVSHTRGWVAVVWSPRPCAVDVELKTRKISPTAAARMGISPDTADPSLPPIAAWCAYEARYKYKSVTGGNIGNIGGGESGDDPEIPEITFHPHPELIVATIF